MLLQFDHVHCFGFLQEENLIECGCCYSEVAFEQLVQCSEVGIYSWADAICLGVHCCQHIIPDNSD